MKNIAWFFVFGALLSGCGGGSSSSKSSVASTSSISSVSSSSESSASSEFSNSSALSIAPVSIEPDMVVILAGSFQMGDLSNTGQPNELPVHTVNMPSFAMSKYETTFDEYDVFAVATNRELPNHGFSERAGRAVVGITWDDATAYAVWLSTQTGKTYRLPSESEWEYAARAGTATDYHWGDETDCTKANYAVCVLLSTVLVGSYAPNQFGLYDMHGNASEWVQDCWNDSYNSAPTDGSAWLTGDCDRRVTRGGSWGSYPSTLSTSLRSAARFPLLPPDGGAGFRLAQDL